MTVHREQNMKREDQQDATIRCLLLTSVSTCFGHHYAHLQVEQRPCYCIWCVVLVLLDVVGSGCGALRCRMRELLASYNAAPTSSRTVSTCFGHHYAHLQENKGPVTVFGVLFWFCCMWLVAVVRRCLVGCDH